MCNPEICSSVGDYPFAPTESSEIAQNYGCLPTPMEIAYLRIEHGKTWACHSDTSKPCLGSLKWLKEHGHPYKVINKNLVTENDNWPDLVRDLNADKIHKIIHKQA